MIVATPIAIDCSDELTDMKLPRKAGVELPFIIAIAGTKRPETNTKNSVENGSTHHTLARGKCVVIRIGASDTSAITMNTRCLPWLSAKRPIIRDVKKVARFLKPLSLSVAEVWHSGKARAAQTAEILAPALAGKAKLVRREGLAPKDAVQPVREAVERFGEDLMIVGHLPLLEKLAASLVTGDKADDVVGFQYGCIVCLDNATEEGGWQVAWMIVP